MTTNTPATTLIVRGRIIAQILRSQADRVNTIGRSAQLGSDSTHYARSPGCTNDVEPRRFHSRCPCRRANTTVAAVTDVDSCATDRGVDIRLKDDRRKA
jgi:hypothetical protein